MRHTKLIALAATMALLLGGCTWFAKEEPTTPAVEEPTAPAVEEPDPVQDAVAECNMFDTKADIDKCLTEKAAELNETMLCGLTDDQEKCEADVKTLQEKEETADNDYAKLGEGKTQEEFIADCNADMGGESPDQDTIDSCLALAAVTYNDLSLCDETSDPAGCQKYVEETK